MRFCIVKANSKKSVLKKAILGAIALCTLFMWVGMMIRPVIISVAKGYGENIVSNNLNQMINDELSKTNFDFTIVTYTPQGKVADVKIDSHKVNLFMTDIALVLKDKIMNLEEIEAKIPIGNFLSNPFFSGMGPKIPVRFLVLANTSVTLEEDFVSSGINQTLYTINLKVQTKVGIYLPGIKDSTTVVNLVPLSQHVIVSDVPDSYTNIEGMEGSVQDTVLDVD